MRLRKPLRVAICAAGCVGALLAWQRPFRQFPGIEYFNFELPPDWQDKTEFAFARLMFPPGPLNGYRGRDAEWHQGISLWTQDFPRADRHFSQALRRLTRLHVRSVEQVVNLEEGDAYDWPWLYAVQVGEWGLSDKQGQLLREYCLRGGFFMADDFHGQEEWYEFESRIKKAFPEYQIREIADDDPIFHSVYDLNERYQVPGQAHLRAGYKSNNGPSSLGAHWRAIFDDKGRVMVAITYNSDLGDAWEYADDPWYPERFSDLAIRVGVNYILYAMAH
ncbi:MAG TPA: DUF4159 domain-containing protein [Candidatus Acidoferrales bacterium]|nr:DUF4159 domain-containing protein [Candidatus Acidoferrales bacterium]